MTLVQKKERTVKCRAINYILLREELYRKTSDDPVLLFIDFVQSMKIMGEAHEGLYGLHQAGDKMR